MKNNSCSALREGDSVQTEWSQVAYNLWCREQAEEFVTCPEKRVVDLYQVIRSVIDKDFSPAEKEAAMLHWYSGMSVAAAAKQLGTSRANTYKALARGKEKVHLVLKHIIDSEEYRIPIEQ